MRPVAVIAASAISALGRGQAAFAAGLAGARPRSGLELAPGLGLGLPHPLVGAAPLESAVESDRATALLVAAALELGSELDRALPAWREQRLRVLVGTSAGPMHGAASAFAVRAAGQALEPALAQQAPYFAPLRALEAALRVPCSAEQVLGACASATLAIGLGCRALDALEAELVIAGGYDALSPFVAAGFEALRALTHDAPRPFRRARDGMALGEGAALLALVRAPARHARGHVLGFGASSDAVHATAPDREGRGVLAAASAALADAGLTASAIDLVSAHATATAYNDAAEARALARLFGDRRVPVHAFKAQVGHTLGAAGALETLCALDALGTGVVPASAGAGELDPELRVELTPVNREASLATALKLSAAFGGLNAALVLGGPELPPPTTPRPRRAVYVSARSRFWRSAELELVQRVCGGHPLVERAEAQTALVLTAVAELRQAFGRDFGERTALIVGTASATIEQNERFEARRRAGRAVEPRRFPLTSPSACAGSCSIVFRLKGPCFSVGSGRRAAHEALELGRELVRAGDVERAVIVAAEDVGPVVTEVFGAAGLAIPRAGAGALLLGSEPDGPPVERGGPLPEPLGPSPAGVRA